MSAGREGDPRPPDGPPGDREPEAPVAPETTGVEKPAPCGLDPFDSFTEWSSPIDEADYADL